jgi:hypothetical protein
MWLHKGQLLPQKSELDVWKKKNPGLNLSQRFADTVNVMTAMVQGRLRQARGSRRWVHVAAVSRALKARGKRPWAGYTILVAPPSKQKQGRTFQLQSCLLHCHVVVPSTAQALGVISVQLDRFRRHEFEDVIPSIEDLKGGIKKNWWWSD